MYSLAYLFYVRNAAKTTSFKMWMSISEHKKIVVKVTIFCAENP